MFVDKVLSSTLGILFLLMLACSGPASEQEKEVITVTKELRHDPIFWDYAASSNMLQTEVGNLASTKGVSEKTRKLGQQAAAFHGEALQRLREIAANEKRIQLPDSLGGADLGLVKTMREIDGEEFDTRYREFIIRTHTSQLGRYEEALRSTTDAQTRAWLLDMQQHLQHDLDLLTASDTVVAL